MCTGNTGLQWKSRSKVHESKKIAPNEKSPAENGNKVTELLGENMYHKIIQTGSVNSTKMWSAFGAEAVQKHQKYGDTGSAEDSGWQNKI